MPKKTKLKRDAFAAIHSSVQGLYRAGAIDKTTLREFDESCLVVPTEIEPQQIKRIRKNNHVSQPQLPVTSTPANQPYKNGKQGQSVLVVWLLSSWQWYRNTD